MPTRRSRIPPHRRFLVRRHFAYFACSEPLAGFDTQRESFLGPYRGFDRPIVVEQGASNRSIAHGWAPHGSHHVKVSLASDGDAALLTVTVLHALRGREGVNGRALLWV